MIAEAGLGALWVAAALSLLQLFFALASLPASIARGEGDHAQHGGGVDGADFAASRENPPIPSQLPLHHPAGGPPPHGSATGRLSEAVRPLAVAQAMAILLAFLALIQLFLRTD